MTWVSNLCLAHMMAIQIANKNSYFNQTWSKDVSHFIPPHNAKNNKKTKGKKK